MIISSYTTFRAVFSVTGVPDVSGYEAWPSAKVRSGGFTAPIAGIPKSNGSFAFPFAVTCNAAAEDAVLGVDDFDFWLSQRTEDTTKQYLLTVPVNSGVNPLFNRSGSVAIFLSTLGAATFPVINEAALIQIFTNTAVYFKRRSDGAIKLAEFMKFIFTDTV